jgi:hypothetical protein
MNGLNDITDTKGTCPRCDASWLGSEIAEEHRHHYGGATHGSRLIGMEDRDLYDGAHSWMCPDCRAIFPRIMLYHAKWKLAMLDSGKDPAFFRGTATKISKLKSAQLKETLVKLEFAFEKAGGRGVELACEVDAHRSAVDIVDGQSWLCPGCLSVELPPTKDLELLDKVLEGNAGCDTCFPPHVD